MPYLGMSREQYIDEMAREIHDLYPGWSYERCTQEATRRTDRGRSR